MIIASLKMIIKNNKEIWLIKLKKTKFSEAMKYFRNPILFKINNQR